MSKKHSDTHVNVRDKQYTVLSQEANPNTSQAKAINAALKAKMRALKVQK